MYEKRQLNNGLKMVVSPMPHMESVSLGIWIGVGGRYESKKQSGMSHLVEHMLFKGTEKYTAKQLKESIEGVGGVFNGFTADEVTCYMVKVPASHLRLGMDILTDMMFNGRFDPDDIVKEKSVICEEIKMYKDQPAEHVGELLGEIMWPNNPLGRPLTGTISNVRDFKRDDMIKFLKMAYHPSNMAITAVGKVAPDGIFSYASSVFKGRREKRPVFESPEDVQKHPRVCFANKKISQSHIAFGFHTAARNARERFSAKILSVILGGNMSSRLFEELREKYGLCYDISSVYKRHSDLGEFIIHTGVDSKKTLKSVVAIMDELKKIKDLGVTDDELVRAKEFAKGQFLLAMESTSSRMMWFGYRLMVDKSIPEVKDLLGEIDKVTKEDIKKVSCGMFRPEGINMAMIGNISASSKDSIRKELLKL